MVILGILRRVLPALSGAEEAVAMALRSAGRPRRAIGTRIEPFRVADVAGTDLTEEDLLGTETLVVFLSSRCTACEPLVRELQLGSVPTLAARTYVVVDETLLSTIQGDGGIRVFADSGESLGEALGNDRTPQAFFIDREGRLMRLPLPSRGPRLRSWSMAARREVIWHACRGLGR